MMKMKTRSMMLTSRIASTDLAKKSSTLVKSIGESSSRNNIEDAPPGFNVHNNVQDDAGEEPNTIDSSDDE
jgi:hypothetical protein